MTEHPQVEEKSAPPAGRRRIAWTLVAGSTALVLLAVGLLIVVGKVGGDASAPPAGSSDKRVVLNISVEDATQARAPEGFTVRVPEDSAAWVPDLAWGGASRAFGEYRVSRERVFYVRPDSASGRQVAVPFQMQPNMISGVAASTTRLTLYDDSLVARGPAIPGERKTFER